MCYIHKALQLADDAIERIEDGGIVPDTQDMMSYALILMLADINEHLEEIENALWSIRNDGVGVG